MTKAIKDLLESYNDHVYCGVTLRSGERTSVRTPSILKDAAKEFCLKNKVSLMYLTTCIDRDRPEGMTVSDAVRYAFAFIKEHPDEVAFND